MAVTINQRRVAATVGGTVDAITATFSPVVTSLTNGLFLIFKSAGANTVTNPTFKADSTAAKTIVKRGNQPLAVGDLAGMCVLVFDSAIDKYELVSAGVDVSDTIWKKIAGYITQIDDTENVRVGADTSWGLSRFEVYSAGNGDIPFFLGDALANFLFIQDLDSSFTIATSTEILLSGNFLAETQLAGDNSTRIATTEYVDTGLATKAAKTFVENISFQDSSSTIAAQTYTLELYAQYAYTINELKIISGSGTCTAAVKINGTDVTGISAVAVSTVIATGTATAANTVAVGDKITLVITSTSSLNNLQASLKTTRI